MSVEPRQGRKQTPPSGYMGLESRPLNSKYTILQSTLTSVLIPATAPWLVRTKALGMAGHCRTLWFGRWLGRTKEAKVCAQFPCGRLWWPAPTDTPARAASLSCDQTLSDHRRTEWQRGHRWAETGPQYCLSFLESHQSYFPLLKTAVLGHVLLKVREWIFFNLNRTWYSDLHIMGNECLIIKGEKYSHFFWPKLVKGLTLQFLNLSLSLLGHFPLFTYWEMKAKRWDTVSPSLDLGSFVFYFLFIF